MPSRKQRRRREKLKRHEYEYVIETEEGEEIPVERPSERDKRLDGRTGRAGVARDRRGREVPQPSLRRVLRRTAVFAPLMFLVVYFTSQGERLATQITTTVMLLAFFIPFSYLVDVIIYRAMVRRRERDRR
jgi:hypothetical protein